MILSPAAEGLGAGDCLELHLRGRVSRPGDTSQGPLFQEEQPAERSLPASFVLCPLLKNKFLEETVSPDAWWVPVGRGLRERVWCFSFRRGEGGRAWLKVAQMLFVSKSIVIALRRESLC